MLVFGRHSLEDKSRILRRGSQVVPLEPLVIQLLLYLIAHRDRALSRQELVDQVWSGAKLERSALSSASAAKRKP